METLGTSKADNLIAGDHPLVTDSRIVGENTTLVRGTYVGIITATTRIIASDSGAADGSQNGDSVLAEDVTTGAGEEKTVTVYQCGEFNENALVFGGTDTAADRKAEARGLSIYFKSSSKQ